MKESSRWRPSQNAELVLTFVVYKGVATRVVQIAWQTLVDRHPLPNRIFVSLPRPKLWSLFGYYFVQIVLIGWWSSWVKSDHLFLYPVSLHIAESNLRMYFVFCGKALLYWLTTFVFGAQPQCCLLRVTTIRIPQMNCHALLEKMSMSYRFYCYLQGSICKDYCAVNCCPACAVCQMDREMQNSGL